MEGRFADIIIDISHEKLDKTFQYIIPERLQGKVKAGTCVSVPFGKGNHLRKGYVIGLRKKAEYVPEKLKTKNKNKTKKPNDFMKFAGK